MIPSTLDFTDTLAKWRVVENDNVVRACLDAAIDGELVDAPVRLPMLRRRQRKRSLAKVCEAARKAGADRVIVDGVVIVLASFAAVPASDSNEWDTVLSEGDHEPR